MAEPVADQGDDGVARTDPGKALEFLDHAEVREACAYLETLPADAGVDELRNLLKLWRAVHEQTTVDGQRKNLLQLARSFNINVPRKDHSTPYLVSGKISEAFVERVSALRAWEAVRNRGGSSSASAAPVFPGPPRGGDSDAAELAGGGEGGAANSGQAELATGSAQRPAKAPAAAQRRGAKRKPQESAGGDLRRLMALQMSELAPGPAERAREQCQRVEAIVTIEDAWDVVRRDEEIPKELKQRVGKARGLLPRTEIRQFLKTYGIRENYQKCKQIVNESLEWQRYEVRRHVVAELEGLPKSHVVPEAGANSGSHGPVGSSSGSAAELAAPGPSDAEYRFEVTPRTLEELMESWRDERSRALSLIHI